VHIDVDPRWYTFLVVGLVLAIDVARTVVSLRAARRFHSAALLSNALHFGSDFVGSLAVLIGLIGVRAGWPDADSIAGLFVAVLVLVAAVRLMRRVGRHHAPRNDVARHRLSQLRRMWALLVVGGGAGFAGVSFVLSSIHHWLATPDRNMTLVLFPIGLFSIVIGIALLVVTTAVYMLGRDRMRTNAEGFSSAPGGS